MKLTKTEVKQARKAIRDKIIERATDKETSEKIIAQLDQVVELTGREAVALEKQIRYL